jgi:hypothetical protein
MTRLLPDMLDINTNDKKQPSDARSLVRAGVRAGVRGVLISRYVG